jgi:CRP-like cAMP-binding protein
MIISKLSIELYKPEDEIIKQYDETYDMFFVSSGNAFAKRKDRQGREKFLCKLDDGSHFGDIALFYRTQRTATVVSGDFSTLALLTRENYLELI